MKKCLTLMTVCGILCKSSGSVGMADELDSGSSARKGVWVQVPSSAYDKKKVSGFCLRLFFLQSEAFLEPRVQSTLRFVLCFLCEMLICLRTLSEAVCSSCKVQRARFPAFLLNEIDLSERLMILHQYQFHRLE